MVDTTMQAQLAELTDRLLKYLVRGVEDLDVEQIHFKAIEDTNSLGFDVWHAVRIIDNQVFFVFDREQPVWLAQGFDARFGLPRIEAGTGMPEEIAHNLRFPDAAGLIEYIEAVRAAAVPKLANATMEYLETPVLARPGGERPRMELVNHFVLWHGIGHLGRVSLARSMMGKDGLL